MHTRTDTQQRIGVGRSTIAAAIAGLAGLAIALAVASSMLLSALGAERPGLEPGYLDYGLRHRTDALVPRYVSTDKLDDYGIRCVQTGWCNIPPGVPQPGNGSK